MYAYTRQAAVHQGIATLLAMALVLWSLGTHMFTNQAAAANLTFISDTLSDSKPQQPSNHTIQFTVPSGIISGQNFAVTFPTAGGEFVFPTVAGFGFADIDVNVNGSSTAVGDSPSGVQWGVATSSSAVTFTVSGGNVASSAVIVIRIGTNATSAGTATGTRQISNPTATTTSYELTVAGSMVDSGQTRVAITDGVEVTADISTTLTFTVNGIGSGVTINGSPTTTFATSTHVALPFGNLSANVSKVLAQRLNVLTNAAQGYTVTVAQDTQLQSSTGADIDGFVNGSWTGTPTAWIGPSANISDENTWGHWGLTSTDGTTTRTLEFASDQWVAASTTPVVVMGHTGPSDGTTEGVGSTTVGYQVQTSALQEAGDDYNTTLTYVATPTF